VKARKQQESALATDDPHFDKRAQALAEGHNEALALAVATRPLADVLEALALTAQRHAGGSSSASILLVDSLRQQLTFGAAPTLPAALSAAIDGLPIGPDVGACGAAAYSGKPVVVPDVEVDPRMRPFLALAREHDIRSCWSMPILSPEGSVLGTFALYRGEVHTPDDVEREGVAQLANTAALVLDREQETRRRQQAESALAAARERVDALLAAAEVATWSWDVVADEVTADTQLRRLFAISDADAAQGRLASYVRAIHPDDAATVLALVERALRTGEVYEAAYRVRHQDGNYRHVIARGKAEFGQDGQAKRLSGVVIDVTARTLAESKLLLSEERYRTLFESIDEGFCIIEMLRDAAGRPCDYRFVETNPAFVKHTGLTDAIGRTIREMVPGHDSHWFEIYGRVESTGEPVRFVERAKAMDRWYDVYAMRLGSTGSHRVAVLFNDISSQKHAEEELRRLATELAAADRRKDEFLATLAHELRNPLAPLRNGLEIMRIAADSPATVAKARDMMERQLGHVVRLVNDLLDVARIGSGKLEIKREPVSLSAVVSSAVETSMPLIEACRHDLSVEIDEVQDLMLDADPTRLAQALGNLLNNAAKYTPPGGRIRIVATAPSDELQIAVIDNGLGMAPTAIPSLFTMFSQVGRDTDHSQGGLGIGLALVRRLMELHGGSASAASDGEGRGSTFTLRLPLRSAAMTSEAATAAAATARAGHGCLRVLIADDNRDAADSLAVSLQLAGHVTAVAYDGLKAVELASGFAPEAAVLDIGMPGLDGYGVARALRDLAATRGIVLVALTGRGAANDRAMAIQAGFDRHIVKPGEPDDIQAVLADVASARNRWSDSSKISK
jgi:PAS domain S-box-containing protein